MGLSLFEFYELTPRQFQNLFNGYADNKFEAEKSTWYQTRWMAFYAGLGNLKKGTTPEKLIEFPWEKILENTGVPSDEEIQETRDRWAEIDRKREQQKK